MTFFNGEIMARVDASIQLNDPVRINKGVVYVPKGIEQTLEEFAKTYSKGLEFGMYLKAEMHYENAAAIILPGFAFLPKQDDTACFFQGQENPPDESFNALVHRHPSGINRFSGYDWQDIITQADCNILFTVERGVCDAAIRFRGINNDDTLLQCEVVIYEPDDDPVLKFSKEEVARKVIQNSGDFYGKEF